MSRKTLSGLLFHLKYLRTCNSAHDWPELVLRSKYGSHPVPKKSLVKEEKSSNYPARCDEQEDERGGAIILQLKNDQDCERAI